MELSEKEETVVHKVLTLGSTKKKSNESSKRKKKAIRGSRKATKKLDSDDDLHLTILDPEEVLLSVEL